MKRPRRAILKQKSAATDVTAPSAANRIKVKPFLSSRFCAIVRRVAASTPRGAELIASQDDDCDSEGNSEYDQRDPRTADRESFGQSLDHRGSDWPAGRLVKREASNATLGNDRNGHIVYTRACRDHTIAAVCL